MTTDIFTSERQAWLRGNRRSAPNDKTRMQAKFDAARAAMGETYCCHPVHRVQRLDVAPDFLAALVKYGKMGDTPGFKEACERAVQQIREAGGVVGQLVARREPLVMRVMPGVDKLHIWGAAGGGNHER